MEGVKSMQVKELKKVELQSIDGGSAAELVGLGIVSGILGGYAGALGMAYAYYNYYKD